ncbi:MAG: phospholipid/cholesterol/gamma-HCH transport system permease protein, partial [Rhodocyclaceae bacterium]|nr:phospholipid/cholesterol/gamma-HCH transport system permease protein [Rhodocyclaceae bacterium]
MPRDPEQADTSARRPGDVELVSDATGARLRLSGDWTLAHHAALEARLAALGAQGEAGLPVDVGALGALDTAGARMLHRLLGPARVAALLADDGA